MRTRTQLLPAPRLLQDRRSPTLSLLKIGKVTPLHRQSTYLRVVSGAIWSAPLAWRDTRPSRLLEALRDLMTATCTSVRSARVRGSGVITPSAIKRATPLL